MYQQIKQSIHAIATQMVPQARTEAITCEPPKDASHGDMASNAAMVLAKQAGKNPRQLAEALADGLREQESIAKVEIAGPGFLNITLTPKSWQAHLHHLLQAGAAYGAGTIGQGQKVNVEYVSANPTGPLHIGHARGAVVGDVLANLLEKTGHQVTREYYINDAGAQVDVLARSVFLRYKEAAGLGTQTIEEGMYPGAYLVPVGEALFDQEGTQLLEMDEADWLPLVRDFALEEMLLLIKADLAALGIHQEVFTSEKALVDKGAVQQAIAFLTEHDLVYRGILEPPKGKTPDDWEPREQLLFKATQFGDDTDRPLQKSDGSTTYFASDIAYHQDKLARGAQAMAITLGVDHGGYVKRLKAIVSALSNKQVEIDVLLCNLVKILQNGEPFKMSKRAGNFVTVADVVDIMGSDVLRFMMLMRKSDAPFDFDITKAQEASKDNPVFYVQYAHARCCSVQRQGQEASIDTDKDTADLSLLTHSAELALIKHLAQFPRVVESAAMTREPHRIAFFLQDLAASFHSVWNTGRDEAGIVFIQTDAEALSAARLQLVIATQTVLAAGLSLMGVHPLEKM